MGDFVSPCIVVQHSVEAGRHGGDNRCAQCYFRLQCAGSAYAHHCEAAQFVANFTGGEVHVCKGIEFVDHYIDVVRADSVAEAHDGFSTVGATDGVEFTGRNLECSGIEEFGYHVHTGRVADQDNTVGKLFRQQVEVEKRCRRSLL